MILRVTCPHCGRIRDIKTNVLESIYCLRCWRLVKIDGNSVDVTQEYLERLEAKSTESVLLGDE